MKLLKIFLFGLLLLATGSSYAWDRTRHDAIACIADHHLTAKARKNIARYLDHPIVYYASYMDKYRDTPPFCKVGHTSVADAQMQLNEAPRDGKVGCVVELMHAMERLKNYKQMSDSLVHLNLMYIIHIVGDMHCPSHIKYAGCKSHMATLNEQKISYHAVWDWGVMQGAHGWSYSEYQLMLDTRTKREIREICQGTPRDWFHESAVACRVIYDWQRADEVYDKEFVLKATPLAESQLLKAGYRLATVLNQLFG